MYWEYFGFEENPFSISPDPRYLYMSKRHQEALAHLVYGIGESGGFVLLSGEVGTGKTTICRSLIEQLPDNVDLAFVLNPRLNEIELLATICDEMAISYPRLDPSLKILIDRLNEHLLRAHAIGRQPVLLIDEAQNLDPKVLEQIRLLTNLETTKRKLLQIVLIGQPELNELLARPDLRQLDQRITARYHLRPLTLPETGGYIRHRLQVGGASTEIFSDKAIRAVYRATGGIPRLINTLCDRCLLGAYAENKRRVDAKLVKGAAKEVLNRRVKPGLNLTLPGLFAAAVAAAAFLLIDPLGLTTPDTIFSVTEADLAANEKHAPPAPVADRAPNTAIPDTASEIAAAPGLELRDVAAAEIAGDPVSSGPTELADEPDMANTTNSDAFPLPPPPPPPMEVTAARHDADASIPHASPLPVSPPSPAPEALTADRDPAASSPGERNTAAAALAPPGAADASVLPNVKYAQGTWSAVAPQESSAMALPGDAMARTPQSTRLAALTPATDAGANSAARDGRPRRSMEEALASAASVGDLESALRHLFATWEYDYVDLKGLSPCKKARYASLRCLQGQGTWHELRIADRPVIITLSATDSRSLHAVLTRLNDEQAELLLGDGTIVETNVGTLSRLWTGDFLLLWRPPAQFSRELKLGVRGEDVLWLRNRLSNLGWDTSGTADELSYDDNLQEAVRRFQRRRGLAVDGIAGARTILQVNAALGTAGAPTIQ